MPKPFGIQFGPWLPDGADVAIGVDAQYGPTTIPLSDCLNVYWADQAYRSMNTFQGLGSALGQQALGAISIIDDSGLQHIYAGTTSDLYHWNGSVWANVSKSAGAYAGTTIWNFATMGECVIASNGGNYMQDLTIGSSPFADNTTAPIGRAMGVVNQFLVHGYITTPTPFIHRVWWSAIGDPNTYPTPLTDAAIAAQSSYEDLEADLGAVFYIASGPMQGIVFQRLGITRMVYVGGDVVFDFVTFERKRGLVSQHAAVQVGDVTHFLAGDGFFMTDGSNVIPTGAATDGSVGLNNWFWTNVNKGAVQNISAAWDSILKCVVFAIPTGSNTLPDTLLLLSPQDRRWTRAAIPTEAIWSHTDGIRHFTGCFNQSHQLGLLTGTPATGYVETYDGAFLDGRVRDVVEVEPVIIVTDVPTVRVGARESLQDSITYSPDNTQDTFTRRVTFDPPPAGRYIRVRVTSGAAQALNGCTLFTEMGGV